MHVRELSRSRAGVAISLLLALVAAVWSVERISLLPPKLTPRSLEMATAYTQLLVDNPKSALTDLGVDSDGISAMMTRAVLVGSLAASPTVEDLISRRTGVPVSELQIETPSTPAHVYPQPVTGRSNSPTDLLRSPAQYRLQVYADPIVPFLDIYAQAPSADAAARLANGAAQGLSSYLQSVESSQGTSHPLIRLRQLGTAQGNVINPGIDLQVAGLVFLFVFGLGCVGTIALGRIRRGWRLAAAPVAQ